MSFVFIPLRTGVLCDIQAGIKTEDFLSGGILAVRILLFPESFKERLFIS